MKKLMLIALLIPMSAMATKLQHVPPPSTPHADPPKITTESSAASSSNATSDSTSNSSSDASGGNSSLNQNITSGKVAPAVFSSGTNNNVPCHGEWHAGASVLVGGISYGRDRKDKDCLLKTAADDQWARGHFQAAARLYCKIQYYAEALGKDCVAMLSEPPPPAESITLNTDSLATKEELDVLRADVHDAIHKAFRAGVGK